MSVCQKRITVTCLCCQRADMDRLQAYTRSNVDMEKKIEMLT